MLNKLTVEGIVDKINDLGLDLVAAYREGSHDEIIEASNRVDYFVDWLQAGRQIEPSVYEVRGQLVAFDSPTCTARVVEIGN